MEDTNVEVRETKNPELVIADVSKAIYDLLDIEREINFYFARELPGMAIKLNFNKIISALIKLTNSYYEAVDAAKAFAEMLDEHYGEITQANLGMFDMSGTAFTRLDKTVVYLINTFRNAGMYVDGFHHYKESMALDPRTIVLVETAEFDELPLDETPGTYFTIQSISSDQYKELSVTTF